MRATNGFPEIRFPLLPLPVTSSSWCLFGCLERSFAIYRSTSLFHTFFSLFSTLNPHRRRHFVFFLSFCLIPAAFQHRGSSARTLSIRRNLLIVSFLDRNGGCAASFLVEEISGPDHAIDFHAPPVRVFLSVFPATPSFVVSVGISWQSERDIWCINWECFYLIGYR